MIDLLKEYFLVSSELGLATFTVIEYQIAAL